MRFRNPPRLISRGGLFRFLEAELWSWLTELFFGLSRLVFTENFESFLVADLTIGAGEEVAINNEFLSRRGPSIPSYRVIVRQTGNGLIADGDTPWTLNLLYMKNFGPDPITVSIIFFK